MEISSMAAAAALSPPSLASTSSAFFRNTHAALPFSSRASLSLTSRRTKGAGRRKPQERKGLSCDCLFGLGVPELVVIAGVVALVFGPKKLPEVGRSIGKTVKSFQQAAKEFETELKKDPDSAIESPPEKPAVVSEEDKQEIKVSGTKETV